MKKFLAALLAVMILFATPALMPTAYAKEESIVDKLIRKACESLKPYELTCLTFARSATKGGDITYGYHDIKKICKAGESDLPKSAFNAILKNSGVKDLLGSLKKEAYKKGSASGSSKSIVLDNTTDLKYSINKCNVKMEVKYVQKSKTYEVYITVTDKYDFDPFMVLNGCNLLNGKSDLKTCAVSVANDTAAMSQLMKRMSKYNIKICLDFTTK